MARPTEHQPSPETQPHHPPITLFDIFDTLFSQDPQLAISVTDLFHSQPPPIRQLVRSAKRQALFNTLLIHTDKNDPPIKLTLDRDFIHYVTRYQLPSPIATQLPHWQSLKDTLTTLQHPSPTTASPTNTPPHHQIHDLKDALTRQIGPSTSQPQLLTNIIAFGMQHLGKNYFGTRSISQPFLTNPSPISIPRELNRSPAYNTYYLSHKGLEFIALATYKTFHLLGCQDVRLDATTHLNNAALTLLSQDQT